MPPTNVRKSAAALSASAAAFALLSGCAAESPSQPGSVSITVAGQPTQENPDQLKAFKRKITDFTKANPGITVTGDESVFDVNTFQALVAGGKLPTVSYVPFTEMQGIIARQQAADITGYVGADAAVKRINPSILKVATSPDNHVYGVPVQAYSMGLLYNRALFTKAGLDPDAPPKTWDEVRAAAKAIHAKTGAQGFGAMTKDNTGGWVLTTMSYAFGSKIQSDDGKQANINNAATRGALEFYRALRWDDDTFGSDFLIGYKDITNALAGGKVGMIVQGADTYTQVVQALGMKPDDFGLAPMPQAPGGLGTLGGGSVAIINPRASAEEIKAALKWIDFAEFGKYNDEQAAVTGAKAAAADKLPVGAPVLPLFDQATTDRYLTWVKDYVNVPREHFTAYFDSAKTLPLVPEPAAKAQETYGILDNVVQAVLTRRDADINALLDDAQKKVQSAIDAG
ncbi:ABC transporter substrate-binding protein [Nonomuraea angiospora]|uniref:ABC-type glycerol-3-phosphate transport system substrate-binding protein n=1 Tax=Nonomuraea angiospora TaxID=46172 RepID=A0ABR9MCC0_9ACTN|nr:extracellular solute-binding protein [Nonomuraea angiospora]MBE1590542.1 ABC-type glycerol-3-phosphate transport system substrate-binding protein [Nonomuraea angiospora]